MCDCKSCLHEFHPGPGPKDKSYAVHKRHSKRVYRKFPPATVTDVAEYVKQFDALNNLTPVKE